MKASSHLNDASDALEVCDLEEPTAICGAGQSVEGGGAAAVIVVTTVMIL